jgi:general secretion pathway protein G
MDRSRHQWAGRRLRGSHGFTLLELVIVVALVAVLAMIATSQFSRYVDRSRSAAARGDIAMLETLIIRYRSVNDGALPTALAEVAPAGMQDPWGRPYIYTLLSGPGFKGKARKDRKLNPLNSDYDLFSAGKDGVFKTQVSNKDSLDDVIRARDGAFIGLGSEL